jgi:potassium-transporting ATPase potassium-binding subunit
MNAHQWLELVIYLGALALVTKPLGLYLGRVFDANGRTWLDPVLRPLEKLTYWIFRVDPKKEQGWKQYTFAMLIFSLVGLLFTYAILRLQNFLPLNPQGLGALSPHLAFNTAVSFVTNTNWQSYGGESTMSYLSQMVALTIHNFFSAAVGMAVAAALVRGIARHTATTIGNFWVDVTRITYYLLLPVCLVLALVLVSQGMIQNFKPYTAAKLMESYTIQVQKTDDKGQPVTTNVAVTVQAPKLDEKGQPLMTNGVAVMMDVPQLDVKGQPIMTNVPVMVDQKVDTQTIVQGPMASQVAIKMLGTNGGGYTNANAAHPFENPTPLSNFLQMLALLCIGSALTYHLGRETKNQKHGWSVWSAMFAMCLAGILFCWWAEARGNPIHQQLGVAAADGNMEGKEVRFGIFNSALFATVTTDASCGAVNSMHDSFTPLGGLVPLFNIQTGEVIFGGVGAGLYGMLIFVILTVFIAGLMVGRTPEYLGKKIESYDVKMVLLAFVILAFIILGFTAWASVSNWGTSSLANQGPHGLSEMLYAFTSGAGNNGSAFAGLNANTPWYDTTLGVDMLLGRFGMIIPLLALAGSLARKKIVPASAGTFPVSGFTFIVLLVGTVILVGALTFLPALALGPIVEHFLMLQGNLF